MSTRWLGLTLLKKIPKGFYGIVLEDNQDDFLLLCRYVRGVREIICEIKLHDITDGLFYLGDVNPEKSNFLREFLVLDSKNSILRSAKIYSTYEVQEVILEEYCSYFARPCSCDNFPKNPTDEFPEFLPDEFPEDSPDEFYD